MDYKGAYENFRKDFSQWNDNDCDIERDKETLAYARIYGRPFLPHVESKFKIPQNSSVFTIGSCFAWEIQSALAAHSFSVPSWYSEQKFSGHEDVKDGALFTRFNIQAMRNELRNIADSNYLGERLLYPQGSEFIDCHFGQGRVQNATNVEDKLAMREYFRAKSREHLEKSSCFIMTLGLSEAFYDKQDDIYLNAPPPPRFALKNASRFEAHIIDYLATLEALEEIRAIVREISNGGAKIILTVSPVALGRSFSGQDVVIANSESKAILRAAAGMFERQHDDVAYFPSFETVNYSDPDYAYRWDRRHVKREMVAAIVDKFVTNFC